MAETEADTCRKFVVPMLQKAGWDDAPHAINEQRTFTDGRIVFVGGKARRGRQKRADYILRYRSHFPIAVVEAKARYKHAAEGLQQARDYAETLGLNFAYATNGVEIIEVDYTTGVERPVGTFPSPEEQVAPLVRRPVDVQPDESYPELGVRSFGRGTFHKPALVGSQLTWQRLFRVHEGDLVLSNIKAWEGAFAVAEPEDDDRVGSHRYLTCVPTPGLATARFICYYLQTPEGSEKIATASPGSADRNRTLGLKKLAAITVPVPSPEKQRWFDRLQAKVRALRKAHAETSGELDALIPAILHEVFGGEAGCSSA